MATSIDDLNLQDVQIGTAANFRKTINDNFKNDSTGHTSIQTVLNNQVKPAITELQTKVGDWDTLTCGTITATIGEWNTSTRGAIATRLGGARVWIANGENGRNDTTKVGDFIFEVYSISS